MDIKYGNRVVSFNDLPESNILVLCQRTVNHIMQNEVAAKVGAWKKSYIEESGTEPDEDEIEAKTEEFRDEQWSRITEGDMTLRSTGPRGTALETVMREVAWEEIKAVLKANKVALPKKASDKIGLKDGHYTKAELIDRRLKQHGDRIKAEAERRQEQAEQAADLDL